MCSDNTKITHSTWASSSFASIKNLTTMAEINQQRSVTCREHKAQTCHFKFWVSPSIDNIKVCPGAFADLDSFYAWKTCPKVGDLINCTTDFAHFMTFPTPLCGAIHSSTFRFLYLTSAALAIHFKLSGLFCSTTLKAHGNKLTYVVSHALPYCIQHFLLISSRSHI